MKRFAMILMAGIFAFIGLGALLAPSASAEVGRVYLYNASSTNIRIACDYGGALKTLAPGQSSQMSGKCTAKTNDTDQLLVSTTKCILYKGPRVTDGYYKVAPGIRVKIHDLANVKVYNISKAGCNGRPYYTTR